MYLTSISIPNWGVQTFITLAEYRFTVPMTEYWAALESGTYPRFSDAEYERRRDNVREMMRNEGLDALLIYADSGFARHNYADLHYLANYLGQAHAYLIFFEDPDEHPTLLFGLVNHGPYVSEVSEIDDVQWSTRSPATKVAKRVQGTAAEDGAIGIVGTNPSYGITIPHEHHTTLQRQLDAEFVDAAAAYQRLRLIKSDEEIEFIQKAGELTDEAMAAVVDHAEPGVSEYELKGHLESASLQSGGYPFISFLSSAPMSDAAPESCYPWKEASGRELTEGDVITTELSAAYWGYVGQIHRPIAVGTEPTETYQEIYDLTYQVYKDILAALKPGNTVKDVRDAVQPIETGGYKIHDGTLHGFGMQLEEPHVGANDPANWIDLPTADVEAFESPGDWTFEENMVMVIQPNTITPDRRHGLQLGNTVVIREDGAEPVTTYPVEFFEV